MSAKQPHFKQSKDAIYMIPLGGCGIFGANMTLYGHQDQWIMVDCGMGFADDTMPGVEILLPDPTFVESLGSKLLAIVLTHAHEDHIGALQSLWPRFPVPIYATNFTIARVKQSLSETSFGYDVPIRKVALDGNFNLGPFSIQCVPMAHSIPEATSLAITVDSVGTLLHTGDWKIDDKPVVGSLTDEKALSVLGNTGVLAVVGDSTNAMVPGHSKSEQSVQDNLKDLISEFSDKLVVLTCFSTNVARLASVYAAARENGRHVCLVGRSLWNIDAAARACGYLDGIPPFLDPKEAQGLPSSALLYVCTGSQGEPRAALSRIAVDEHRALRLRPGDVVIFSSRDIPGNERAIDRIKNRLYARGVQVITVHDAPVHASGHAYRDEIKKLLSWVNPKFVVPVHGEMMQMEKHAALAKEQGVSATVIPVNGDVIELSQRGIAKVGEVPSGILAIEGNRIVNIEHEAILTRKRMMWNGSAIVTVVVDRDGVLLAAPKITALGLLDENNESDAVLIAEVGKTVAQAIQSMPKHERKDNDVLSEAVRVTTRRFFQDRFDRKPQTRVHLVRI